MFLREKILFFSLNLVPSSSLSGLTLRTFLIDIGGLVFLGGLFSKDDIFGLENCSNVQALGEWFALVLLLEKLCFIQLVGWWYIPTAGKLSLDRYVGFTELTSLYRVTLAELSLLLEMLLCDLEAGRSRKSFPTLLRSLTNGIKLLFMGAASCCILWIKCAA